MMDFKRILVVVAVLLEAVAAVAADTVVVMNIVAAVVVRQVVGEVVVTASIMAIGLLHLRPLQLHQLPWVVLVVNLQRAQLL